MEASDNYDLVMKYIEKKKLDSFKDCFIFTKEEKLGLIDAVEKDDIVSLESLIIIIKDRDLVIEKRYDDFLRNIGKTSIGNFLSLFRYMNDAMKMKAIHFIRKDMFLVRSLTYEQAIEMLGFDHLAFGEDSGFAKLFEEIGDCDELRRIFASL